VRAASIVHCALTSADEAPTRDPMDRALHESADRHSLTTVDNQAGQVFTEYFCADQSDIP